MIAAGQPHQRARSLWTEPVMLVIVGLSIFPAVSYNWMPVLFNVLASEFAANLEQLGTTQQFMFTSGLGVVLVGGWLTERIGLRWSATSAMLTCAAGQATIGLSGTFAALLLGCAVYGFGMAWMYLIYGVFVSRHFPDQRQKAFLINNMVLSLVGGTGPFLLGLWLSRGLPWRGTYVGIAVLNALFAVAYCWRYRDSPGATPAPARQTLAAGAAVGHPLGSGAMWLVGLGYILHGVAEIGAISWVGKLYSQRLGIPVEAMALFVSANVVAFAMGRFLLTFIAGRLRDRILLACCAAGGSIAFASILVVNNYYVALLLMALSGIFMSGNTPAMNSLLAARFSLSLPHAFATFQGFGAIGSGLGPRLIGYAGDQAGLARAVWLIPCCAAALAALAIAWEIVDRQATRRTES